MTLRIVQDPAADELLSNNAFALLCGMLLQQQVSADVAFAGPAKIADRLGSFEPADIESEPAEDFAKLCAADPPVHPYPESMSVLLQAVARFVVANYAGNAASLWETAGSGEHLLSRLMLLPGFGKRQAQIFVALLGKQLDVRPPGWEAAAGPFGQSGGYRSVADVHDAESLEKVLAGKSKGGGRGDADSTKHKSDPTKSSKGPGNVTPDEELPGKAERGEARKAARKAAKKAAKAARQGGAGETTATAEAGDNGGRGGRGGAKRPGLKTKKAAKRAAKRAARASAADPDAPAKKGAGRSADGSRARAGGGRGKKAAARRGRRQDQAGGDADAQNEAVDGAPTGTGSEESAATPQDGETSASGGAAVDESAGSQQAASDAVADDQGEEQA